MLTVSMFDRGLDSLQFYISSITYTYFLSSFHAFSDIYSFSKMSAKFYETECFFMNLIFLQGGVLMFSLFALYSSKSNGLEIIFLFPIVLTFNPEDLKDYVSIFYESFEANKFYFCCYSDFFLSRASAISEFLLT